jgi:hypothetical protein
MIINKKLKIQFVNTNFRVHSHTIIQSEGMNENIALKSGLNHFYNRIFIINLCVALRKRY